MDEDVIRVKFIGLKKILKSLPMAPFVDLTESIRESYQLPPDEIILVDGTDVYISGRHYKLYLAIEGPSEHS